MIFKSSRYCKEDIVRYIAGQGAKLDMLNQIGSAHLVLVPYIFSPT